MPDNQIRLSFSKAEFSKIESLIDVNSYHIKDEQVCITFTPTEYVKLESLIGTNACMTKGKIKDSEDSEDEILLSGILSKLHIAYTIYRFGDL